MCYACVGSTSGISVMQADVGARLVTLDVLYRAVILT